MLWLARSGRSTSKPPWPGQAPRIVLFCSGLFQASEEAGYVGRDSAVPAKSKGSASVYLAQLADLHCRCGGTWLRTK